MERKTELGLQESFMTLSESLLNRESVTELIKLRQQYSKEPITRSNAPAITSGCTAVVALLKNNFLYVANLGDPRSVLSRNNKAFPLSSDHKPEDQTEKQRIERAGGEVVSGSIIKVDNSIKFRVLLATIYIKKILVCLSVCLSLSLCLCLSLSVCVSLSLSL